MIAILRTTEPDARKLRSGPRSGNKAPREESNRRTANAPLHVLGNVFRNGATVPCDCQGTKASSQLESNVDARSNGLPKEQAFRQSTKNAAATCHIILFQLHIGCKWLRTAIGLHGACWSFIGQRQSQRRRDRTPGPNRPPKKCPWIEVSLNRRMARCTTPHTFSCPVFIERDGSVLRLLRTVVTLSNSR